MELYNSVPYDTSEMKSIESSVLSRILNSSCSEYIIMNSHEFCAECNSSS